MPKTIRELYDEFGDDDLVNGMKDEEWSNLLYSEDEYEKLREKNSMLIKRLVELKRK